MRQTGYPGYESHGEGDSAVGKMAVQIYVKPKSFDCQKAERFFRERGITPQRIEMVRYPLTGRALDNVASSVGLRKLIDPKAKSYEKSNLRVLMPDAAVKSALTANPDCFACPIVRWNGKATVGYCPETWLEWIKLAKEE